MAVLGNVLGFGAFGIAARAWQLGIQKRNLLQSPGAYLLSGGVFGALGYWLVGVEQRQVELISQKRKELEARRNPAQTFFDADERLAMWEYWLSSTEFLKEFLQGVIQHSEGASF